jgi:anti-anti-sigma factor
MEIRAQTLSGVTLVAVSGSIDASTAEEFDRSLAAQLESGPPRLVVDLGAVDYMGSVGLRALVAALQRCRKEGGDLRLAAPQPGIVRVMSMSGMDEVLAVFPTADDALASYAPVDAKESRA